MAKNPPATPRIDESSISWESTDGREVDIEASRMHLDERRPIYQLTSTHKGKLHFPAELIPPGWKYIWAMERLLNEDKPDNIENLYSEGYDFVKKSDHPELVVREMSEYFARGRSDDLIRRGGMVLMKMPLEEYNMRQEGHRLHGEDIRKQSTHLTDYLGDSGPNPRFVVENKHGFTNN